MAYLAITDPEIANGAVITQTLMHKNRDNLQAICDDDATIPPANTLKRMGRQNAIIIGASDPGGVELLRVGGGIRASGNIQAAGVINSDTGLECIRGSGLVPYVQLIRSTVAQWNMRIASNANLEFATDNAATKVAFTGGGNVIIGTDPGGSELLRVGGAIKASGDMTVGVGAGAQYFIANGAASGSNSGAAILMRNAGGNIISIGNYSAIYGGAYDARPVINASNTIFSNQGMVFGTDPGGSALLRVGGDVSIKVPMTWPNANATGILQNDGSGNLTWGNTGGGGTTVSFVPSVVSVSGGSAHTYGATRIARYWLVGKQVFFVINVGINVKDPTAANGVLLALLPLPAWDVYEYPIQVFMDNVNIAGYIGVIGRILPNNPARVALYKIATNGAQTELVMSDVAAFSYFSVSGSYIIP